MVNDASVKLGIPVVHGSIFRFEGMVTVFDPKNGPTYRDMVPEPPPAELAPSCAEAGVLGVLPGIIGSLQAIETIKLILDLGDSLQRPAAGLRLPRGVVPRVQDPQGPGQRDHLGEPRPDPGRRARRALHACAARRLSDRSGRRRARRSDIFGQGTEGGCRSDLHEEAPTRFHATPRRSSLRGVADRARRPLRITGQCRTGSGVRVVLDRLTTVENEAEAGFLDRLNALRRAHGRITLAPNASIAGPARAWSDTMAAQIPPGGSASNPGWLHHARDVSSTDGVRPDEDYVYLVGQAVPDWTRVAENVGMTSTYPWCTAAELRSATNSAVDALHDAFVRSSGHFDNMIGDHNQVGIGVQIEAREMWVTVRFAKGSLPTQASAATARYVDAVYRLFVNRGASTNDVQRWAAAVQSDQRSNVTGALAVSDEWAGVRVNDLYRKVLGRDADPGGRAYWVSQIAQGVRLEQVAAEMYGSPEYFQRSASANYWFVSNLYRDIQGRNADDGGRSYWLGLLDSGRLNRSGVAANFYDSIESRRARVHTLYVEILGRTPDPGGRDYWAETIRSIGDVVLAAELAASKEYYLRVAG